MTTYPLVARQNLELNRRQDDASAVMTNSHLAYLVENAASDNKLYCCAIGLLAIITQLRSHRFSCNVNALRQSLVEEISAFTIKAANNNINKQTIDAARYILCAVLDEFILNQQLADDTDWGIEEDWSKQSLINLFYYDVWGGEKFFEILDHMLEDVKENIEILEVILLCLALGFEGKYRMMDYGNERLDLIKNKLFVSIQSQRDNQDIILFSYFKSAKTKQQGKFRLFLLSVIGLLIIGFLISSSLYLNNTLNTLSTPAYQTMHNLISGKSV